MSLNLSLFVDQRRPAGLSSCHDLTPTALSPTKSASPTSSITSPKQTSFQEFLGEFYGTRDCEALSLPDCTTRRSLHTLQKPSFELHGDDVHKEQ